MNLKHELENYTPWNEQEARDQAVLLHLLETQPDIFSRENQTAHFSASAWLLNKEHTKVLMVYHNIYHAWSWTGGHADGEQNLLSVAMREAMEETGVTNIYPVKEDIFSIEILTVDGHIKKGSAAHKTGRKQRRKMFCIGGGAAGVRRALDGRVGLSQVK